MRSTVIFAILIMAMVFPARADDKTCAFDDVPCLQDMIAAEAKTIDQPRWRNQTLRDLAVSKAFQGDIAAAMTHIKQIDNPDTQAMTIRAIGMALALHKDMTDAQYRTVFAALDQAAQGITHGGARDIAYTYIAMAQAFAGLDADATKTTQTMTNPALKHKAYGETAEIQAQRGEYDLAMQSIQAIDSLAFKNKALGIVADIFLKDGKVQDAYQTAIQITNPTKKAETLQKIVNMQVGLDAPK